MKSVPNWAEVFVAIATVVGVIVGIISRTAVINFLRKVWSYIKAKGYMTILRAIAVTITAIMIVAVFFTTKQLPTADTIGKTVKNVGNKIASTNMVSLNSSMDNITHTIINYHKDPESTRNRVYENALRQAADKGYVFYIPQIGYYITVINKKNDECLLTEEERKRIEKSLDEILKRTNKQDQISLMNEILSDIRVKEELWKPKKRKVPLSELDIVGIVGGYIGELILKP